MTLETTVALSIGIIASGEDLWRRNISNWIPLAALVAALIVQTLNGGWSGLLAWFLGAAIGFGVFYLRFIFFGTGGGDVKLMAGFGALLGPSRVVDALVLSAIIGAVIALFALIRREVSRFWRRRKNSTDMQIEAGSAPASQHDENYIPYAPAITLGSWLALIPKGV